MKTNDNIVRSLHLGQHSPCGVDSISNPLQIGMTQETKLHSVRNKYQLYSW